jgi:hypothetical protein
MGGTFPRRYSWTRISHFNDVGESTCKPPPNPRHVLLLILDNGYFLWRFGIFLPFALFTGLVIKLRPALLPYFVIVHALLDVSTTVLVYLMI